MGRLAGTHDVVLGARDPAATAAGDPLPGGVEVAALPDALAGADVVIVAIPG
jgi:predicted dinucleotide-binding enzyme